MDGHSGDVIRNDRLPVGREVIALALLEKKAWRSVMGAAIEGMGTVRFCCDPAAALEAHQKEPATLIILEWGAHPAFELSAFGADPPPLLCILADAADTAEALRAGAADCEIDPTPSRLESRLRVMGAQRQRTRQLRADAGVLGMMTGTWDAGFRFWEFDLMKQQFTRVLPGASSERRRSFVDLEAMSWESLYPKSSRRVLGRAIVEDIEHHRATGELRPRVLDLEINNVDGSSGCRRLVMGLALDEVGNPSLVRAVGWDTTDSADVVQRMRAETEYRRLFESAHDAIIVFDPEDETILDVNARGCEIYGRTRAEMLGTSLRAFSADLERGSEKVKETLECGALVRFETVQYRKDGTQMHLDINASCIEYRGKQAILSINRDVTERHAHEAELRKRDGGLAEATRIEAVGRLAGGIAHDFNNLLMVIESCTDVLVQNQGKSEEVSEEVFDLEDAVARATGLVRQLLMFSRQATVEVRTFNLVEVARRLGSMLRRLVGEDIELNADLDACVPVCVRMDPSQLEQVIVNLVVNARDSIAGVGAVSMAVEPSTKEGFIELRVRDNGSGMDEATRARIFEPFFTTKGAGTGTGLGLSTVHGIVAASGGEVLVESELGVGSEFRILLPIAESAPEAVSSTRTRRPSRPGSESILLVEDERAVRRALARELRKFGYRVLESEDGAAALELADSYEEHIDLLVTDVVMPRMGGAELATRLLSSRPGMRVVFMSGYMARPNVLEIVESGLGPVLSKPFPPAKLMETVRELFEAVSG